MRMFVGLRVMYTQTYLYPYVCVNEWESMSFFQKNLICLFNSLLTYYVSELTFS